MAAFEIGYEAGVKGAPDYDNPYDRRYFDRDFREWEKGWEKAQKEKSQIKNSTSFTNGRNKALAEIGAKIENRGLMIRGTGSGFAVTDNGKVIKEFKSYDEAVKYMTSTHSARKEAEDWREERKAALSRGEVRKGVRGY